jgi:CyaY protein
VPVFLWAVVRAFLLPVNCDSSQHHCERHFGNTAMTETEFNEKVDATLLEIEETLEEIDAPVECENVGGILTLSFDNGSKIIINRQTPLLQLWVAARSGGYHFDYDEAAGQWCRDTDKEGLYAILERDCSEQAGASITF